MQGAWGVLQVSREFFMSDADLKKKGGYFVKEVQFGKQKLVLYSLDGVTWSTRRTELAEIKARHEREKVTFEEIKGTATEQEAGEAPEGEQEEGAAAEDEEEQPQRRFRGRPPSKMKAPDHKPGRAPLTMVAQNSKKAAAEAKVKAGSKKSAPSAPRAAVAAPKKRGSSAPAKKAVKAKGKKKRAA